MLDSIATEVIDTGMRAVAVPVKLAGDTLSASHALPVTASAEPIARSAVQSVRASALDTLFADSLSADSAVSVSDSLANLEFSAIPDTLLNAAPGFGGTLAYSPFNDNWVSGIVLGCFFLLVFTLAWSRNFIMQQARDFFVPSNLQQNESAVKSPAEQYVPIVMSIVMWANGGLLLYIAACQNFDLTVSSHSLLAVLGLCMASFVAYCLLRWYMYRFVNWIFFKATEKRAWNNGFSFILILESVLLCPALVFTLNAGWDAHYVIIFVCSAFILTRILLLYHSFRVFFPKIYGLLHLFAYLCTLELIPALFLWKILTIFSEDLITK